MQSLAWTGYRAVSSSLLSRGLSRHRGRAPAAVEILKCCWSSDKRKKMDFRVATYNILCSHLAEPTRFPQCSKKNLDPPTRLRRIMHKLGNEV